MSNKNKRIINKNKSIKNFLLIREIIITETSEDNMYLSIDIHQFEDHNNQIKISNSDDYIILSIISTKYNDTIQIKIDNNKKYEYNSLHYDYFVNNVISIKDGEIIYKDTHNIHIK